MLASMTGFGRAILDASCGRIIAEIQSINRKHLEISVSLPKEFVRFEFEIRKWVGECMSRGQIAARLSLIPNAAAIASLLPNAEVLKSLKEGWEHLSRQVGLDPRNIDLPFLILHSPIHQETAAGFEPDLGDIEQCIKKALSALVQMKRQEGAALAVDLRTRLDLLGKHLTAVERLVPGAVLRFKEKLNDKIKELKQLDGPDVEDRIVREVFLYAERLDVSEEIVRLRSHFQQFQQMCGGAEGVSGKKMEFLIQEIGREINTLGSKSADVHIAHLVVEMKSELEKMREQVQNIE